MCPHRYENAYKGRDSASVSPALLLAARQSKEMTPVQRQETYRQLNGFFRCNSYQLGYQTWVEGEDLCVSGQAQQGSVSLEGTHQVPQGFHLNGGKVILNNHIYIYTFLCII